MPLPVGWHAVWTSWGSKRRWHALPGRCMDCGEPVGQGRSFWCQLCWDYLQDWMRERQAAGRITEVDQLVVRTARSEQK